MKGLMVTVSLKSPQPHHHTVHKVFTRPGNLNIIATCFNGAFY